MSILNKIPALIFFCIILLSCNTPQNTKTPVNNVKPINNIDQTKTAEWIVNGIEAYSICVFRFHGEEVAKPIKVKVLHVRANDVKVKAVENVSFEKTNNCDKSKVNYGETWWETEGDIYQTRSEAKRAIQRSSYSFDK